jgi:tetratricopeptide (TPR) repeat protein
VRSRRRAWLLAALVLVLAAIAGGAYYVLRVGRSRIDPYGKAVEAHRAGDDAAAESFLRSVLRADPAHLYARRLLIEILANRGRAEEAEELARPWLAAPETEALGLRTMSELAFQRGDVAAAVRLARTVADREPAFAQMMLMQVQDSVGTPESREKSVAAAETLAVLTKDPEVRASAYLFAAETLRDLAESLPEGALRSAYAARQETDRALARDAAYKTRADLNRLRAAVPEAAALLSRIQLLSTDRNDQQQAVEELEAALTRDPTSHHARVALVRHLALRGEGSRAATHAQMLGGDVPPLLSLRAVGALTRAGERKAALDILEGVRRLPDALRSLVRARILIEGDENERGQAKDTFERLALENPADLALVEEAHRRIRQSGDAERATRLLEVASSKEPKLRPVALLARAGALGLASDGGAQAIAELAATVKGPDLVSVFGRLLQDPKSGERAALDFLGKAVNAAVADPNEVRILRAAFASSRQGLSPTGQGWEEIRRADLRAIAADPAATGRVLVRAATLAAAAEEGRLQGALLGKILSRPVEGAVGLPFYLRAVADPDDANREAVAEGMRESAAAAPDASAWLESLAGALVRGDAALLRRGSAEGVSSDGRPQSIETELQLLLAARAKDWPSAEAFARALLSSWPNLEGVREKLGAVLLSAAKYPDVLELHRSEPRAPTPRLQRIEALRMLERSEEAIAEARSLVADTEASNQSLVVLANLLRASSPEAALAAVSAASGNAADLLRAELLEQRGEESVAEQVYEQVLRSSGNRDVAAWRALARLRSAQGRTDDFVRRADSLLEKPPPGMPAAETAQLVLLRGQAHEQQVQYELALKDYLRVVDVLPRDATALNNAAWLLFAHSVEPETDPARRFEKALALAERAVEAAPGVAQVHHTRAKILAALRRHDAALAALDRALELTAARIVAQPKPTSAGSTADPARRRHGRYLVDKAVLLEAMGDTVRAKEIYERVRAEHPRTSSAAQAEEALARLK